MPATYLRQFGKPCDRRIQSEIFAGLESNAVKAEQRAVSSNQLTPIPLPQPMAKIRILSFVPNAHCAGRIHIHRNMKVPSDSVLFQTLVELSRFTDQENEEDLGQWKHSDGKHLPSYA